MVNNVYVVYNKERNKRNVFYLHKVYVDFSFDYMSYDEMI